MNITILLVLGLVIYMIVRQFQEQAVRFPALLVIPAVLVYYTYTNVVAELTHPLISPLLIVAGLVVGLILGGVIGWYRGGLARLRLDSATAMVFAKASALSMVVWCVFFVLKIATSVGFYMGLAQTSALFALVMAVVTTLFLGNVLAEKARLYQRSTRYQVRRQGYAPSQQLK